MANPRARKALSAIGLSLVLAMSMAAGPMGQIASADPTDPPVTQPSETPTPTPTPEPTPEPTDQPVDETPAPVEETPVPSAEPSSEPEADETVEEPTPTPSQDASPQARSRMSTQSTTPEPAVHPGITAIKAKYAFPSVTRVLGKPTMAEPKCGLTGDGCFQAFEKGYMHWTRNTGARFVANFIYDRWRASGTERGTLGYPVTDTVCGLTGGGCLQVFQGGTIYWSKATGARVTSGKIRDTYARERAERVLGYPTTEVRCILKDGGCFQGFQNGSIHWTPKTGAHATKGSIRQAWWRHSSERGVLGYPIGPQVCGLKDGGCYQPFQGGSVHSQRKAGTHVTRGVIRSKWWSLSSERGGLGYPINEQRCSGLPGGGCRQGFQGGWIYWSKATGARYLSNHMHKAYSDRGGVWGTFGYPTRDKVRTQAFQQFQGGRLYPNQTSTPSKPTSPSTKLDKRCLTGRVMCASKAQRKMWWVIDGKIIKTFDARFGKASTPSDNGQFKVYWKSYNHTSTIYGTWMPRAMFYNGGEAVHYSPDFKARGWVGGSGGCVNIRDWAGINWLYNQVRNGDKVVVY